MYCTHASLSTSTVPGRTASASDGTRTVKSSSKLEPTPGVHSGASALNTAVVLHDACSAAAIAAAVVASPFSCEHGRWGVGAGGPGCGERAGGRAPGRAAAAAAARLHGVLQHPERGAARRELGEDGRAERPVGAPHLQLARLPPPRAGQRRRVRDRGGAVERERGLLAEERGDADHEGEGVQPLARRLVERHLQVEAQRVGLAVAVVVLLPRPQLARAQRGAERVVERARRRPAHFDGHGRGARRGTQGGRIEAVHLDERLVPEPHERLLARRHLLRPQPARGERDDERQHDRCAPVDEHAARAARAPVRAVLDDERPLEDHRHRWRNSKPLGATAVGSSRGRLAFGGLPPGSGLPRGVMAAVGRGCDKNVVPCEVTYPTRRSDSSPLRAPPTSPMAAQDQDAQDQDPPSLYTADSSAGAS